MSKFIKLTKEGGAEVLVNVEKIEFVEAIPDAPADDKAVQSLIKTSTEDVEVLETMTAIQSLLINRNYL